MSGDTEQAGDSGIQASHVPGRRTLVRDIAILQLKLIVDGLRDFVLVPVSLLVGIASLTRRGNDSGLGFYRLLQTGRESDRWINLFGAADRITLSETDAERFPDEDIDALASRVEAFLVEEYQSGGVTRQAKERIQRLLTTLTRRRGN